MVLRVKKNTKCMQVIDANTKKVLWSKLFGSEQSDGACILPTSAVKVVVYDCMATLATIWLWLSLREKKVREYILCSLWISLNLSH